MTAIVEDLVCDPERFQDLKGPRLQAICLAGSERAGLGVDAEKRIVRQAIAREKKV
jgi:hypothetical protein